jgi:hypothetical protein
MGAKWIFPVPGKSSKPFQAGGRKAQGADSSEQEYAQPEKPFVR